MCLLLDEILQDGFGKTFKKKRLWKQEYKVILQNWQMIFNSMLACDQTTDLLFNLQHTLLLV